MEYGQELDKIKTEVTNSGKKLEDISKSIQSLSGLTKLQESITNFQGDNVLNRIETKLDILAQTDYSDLFNFSIDNLKEDLNEKNSNLSQKINFIQELISHFSDNSEKDILQNLSCLDLKIAELSENIAPASKLDSLNEKLNDLYISLNSIKTDIELISNNSNDELIKSKIAENISFEQDFDDIKTSIQDSHQSLNSSINNIIENIENTKLDSFSEKLNDLHNTIELIKTDVESISNNSNDELIKSKINHINTKLVDFSQSVETQIANIAENISFQQDFNSIQTSIQSLYSNIDNLKDNFDNTKILPEFEEIRTSLSCILDKIQLNSDFSESSKEDLAFLKENFYKINEKFSEITHLIRTNTAENEELNDQFEKNITHFTSGFQNLYDQFNGLDNVFKSSFADFRACIQDIYDQFSTIDNRSDLDQVKLYVQSFNNKIISIAEILESLKDNGFSIKVDNKEELDKIQETQNKMDSLNSNVCTFLDKIDNNSSIENTKHSEVKETLDFILGETKNFSNRISVDNKENIHQLQETQNKMDSLNNNVCTFLDKIDNNSSIENTKHSEVKETLDFILGETKNFSNRISDEFSSITSPLSSAIELTNELKETLDKLLATDNIKVQQEAAQLLEKFENVYKNSEDNLECLFHSSKHFYEKLDELKNDFSNISYDTNSKISDFISKADNIELKILNNISSSENALTSLKNISKFAENQINLTSESLNLLKTGVSELSDDFNYLKNDITDISSKINKIILNEKENSVSLASSFDNLKEEINKSFETNIENANQAGEKIVKKVSDELKDFNKKIDKLEEDSSKIIATSEDVKSALVCMAEWFDSAGKLIEENNKNIKKHSVEIGKTDSLIKKSEENISEQIKRISDKLNRFEIRMENIEGKIEKLQDNNGNREVLNILSDILEKVELSNERSKSNEIILNRLENLEFKLEEIENAKTAKARKKLSDCST